MFKSLQNKFLAYSLILVMFVIVTCAVFFFTNKSKHLLKLKLDNSIETSELYSNHIALLIDKHISVLSTLAEMEQFQRLITPENTKLLSDLITSEHYNFVNTIFITKEGTFHDPSGYNGDIKDRDYYKRLAKDHPPFIISNPIIGRVTNAPVIVIGIPILDKTDDFIGAIAGVIDLETVSKLVSSIKLEGASYGWILDETGLVLAHPKTEIIMNYNIFNADALGYPGLSDIGENMYKQLSGTGEYFDSVEDVAKIITYRTIPNTPGWRLAITTPKQEINRPISDMSSNLIFSTFMIMLITILITIFFAHKFSQPLLKLTEAVKQSEQMDFIMLDYEESTDEIGQLVSAYNKMTKSIKHHTENLEYLVSERTAELNSANRQLDEHNQQLNHLNSQLINIASTDQLTGLINRTKLYEEIGRLIKETDDFLIHGFTLLFMDLDNFKFYNDNFGHDIGDYLLTEFTKNILLTLPSPSIFSRYGGDEFIILLPNQDIASANELANKLINDLSSEDGYNHHIHQKTNSIIKIPPSKYIGLSIGISHYSAGDRKDIDQMIKDADTQMYKMKQKNKQSS